MPQQTFEVTAPNGRKREITGSRVPTEAELREIFKAAGGDTQALGTPAAAPVASAGIGSILVDAIPTVGGMVGGMVGGVPGAIAGGMAGKGYETLIERGGEIPGALVDVAKNLFSEPVATMRGFVEGQGEGSLDAAKAGGVQGAGELAGVGLSKGAGVLSKWLMNRATTRVTERLTREFPDLADTLIDNALTVSKGGYDKARGLLVLAKKKANAALAAADNAGAVVPVQINDDVAQSLKTALLEDAIKNRGLATPTHGAVTSATNRMPQHLRTLFKDIDAAAANGWAVDLKPSHADLLKRRLQQESKPVYANQAAPNGPRSVGMDATERTELAQQINNAIDAIANGYKAANAEAKPLIGAVRGIKQAIRPSGNLYQAMVRPAVGAAAGAMGANESGVSPYVGAMAGAALTSPAGMSREAILLARPEVRAILRQLPRASAEVLMQLLSERSGSPSTPQAPPAGGQK